MARPHPRIRAERYRAWHLARIRSAETSVRRVHFAWLYLHSSMARADVDRIDRIETVAQKAVDELVRLADSLNERSKR